MTKILRSAQNDKWGYFRVINPLTAVHQPSMKIVPPPAPPINVGGVLGHFPPIYGGGVLGHFSHIYGGGRGGLRAGLKII